MRRVLDKLRSLLGLCAVPGCGHGVEWTVLHPVTGDLLPEDGFMDLGGGRVWLAPEQVRMVAESDGPFQVLSSRCGKVSMRGLRLPSEPPFISLPPGESAAAEVLDE